MSLQQAEQGWRAGGCQCGAVRFEVLSPPQVDVLSCNCTICAMTGYLHLIVGKERFRLLKGEDNLTTYAFNTRTARHVFCSTCGVKSFYYPRSHPDGVSVNYRCLDDAPPEGAHIAPFDGRNWEASAESLSTPATQDGR